MSFFTLYGGVHVLNCVNTYNLVLNWHKLWQEANAISAHSFALIVERVCTSKSVAITMSKCTTLWLLHLNVFGVDLKPRYSPSPTHIHHLPTPTISNY